MAVLVHLELVARAYLRIGMAEVAQIILSIPARLARTCMDSMRAQAGEAGWQTASLSTLLQ